MKAALSLPAGSGTLRAQHQPVLSMHPGFAGGRPRHRPPPPLLPGGSGAGPPGGEREEGAEGTLGSATPGRGEGTAGTWGRQEPLGKRQRQSACPRSRGPRRTRHVQVTYVRTGVWEMLLSPCAPNTVSLGEKRSKQSVQSWAGEGLRFPQRWGEGWSPATEGHLLPGGPPTSH